MKITYNTIQYNAMRLIVDCSHIVFNRNKEKIELRTITFVVSGLNANYYCFSLLFIFKLMSTTVSGFCLCRQHLKSYKII